MTPIENTLLFVGNPSLALESFAKSLAARLAKLDIPVEEISPSGRKLMACNAGATTVAISASSKPLAADQFIGAMDSPLSKPVIGLLSDTLRRHSRHITLSVSERPESPDDPLSYLDRLKIAHAATSLLVEWHMPAAVHWKQSNQLLSGAQYLQLISDPCPWVLFAQARVTSVGEIDQMVRNYGLRLDEAVDFIGRPIEFVESPIPLDEIHAAALSFLRHAVETGTAVPDGHTFGPKKGPVFKVRHVEMSEDNPKGLYQLSGVQNDTDPAATKTARTLQANFSGTSLPTPTNTGPDEATACDPRERTRSMAISYLMLVIMPPVGAVLLMSNAIFGSSVFRTGLVAAGSVAIAVIVGAMTFMNQGLDNARLANPGTISSQILAD